MSILGRPIYEAGPTKWVHRCKHEIVIDLTIWDEANFKLYWSEEFWANRIMLYLSPDCKRPDQLSESQTVAKLGIVGINSPWLRRSSKIWSRPGGGGDGGGE